MLVKILVTVTIFAGIILFEVPSLIENNNRRELSIFFILLFPALVITILEAIGTEMPQLMPLLAELLKPVTSWFEV